MRKQGDQSIPTRSSLLNQLGDWDDHESWKTFVDTYWQPVFRIALKAGLTEAEAQDATQETMLAIARKIRSFKRDPALGSFRAWLFHTARWKITDQFRKRRPGSASCQPGPTDPDATGTTERIPDPHGCELEAIWNEEYHQNLIEVALERVKRRVDHRVFQIYDCHVVKQWSVEEVMRTLGVTRHQVYNAKSRISKLLRKTIEQLETKML